MENQKEIWKDVKGYEGLYQVSNLGKVKSLDRHVSVRDFKRFYKGRYISENRGGFYSVADLYKNGVVKKVTFHRLVLSVFTPNPENKPYINHKDMNKRNNNVNNLEWCTPLENSRHAVENGAYIRIV